MGFSSGKPEKVKVSSKTQEKAAKAGLDEFLKGKGLRRDARSQIGKLLEGRYLPDTSISDLGKGLQKSLKYTRGAFDPMKQEARQEFQQSTLPEILNAFGADAKSSSALNQALATAGKDLELGLASRFAPMEMGLAQQLLNMRQQNKAVGLQSMLGAASVGMGQGYQPLSLPSQTQTYAIQPQSSTSSDLIKAAGAIGAGYMMSSKEAKENIKDYDKSLETLEKVKVKQYDYKVDVPGRKNDRVGLIAEDLPEEITAEVDGVLSVDIYGLASILVNCVKDLNNELQELKSKLEEQKV